MANYYEILGLRSGASFAEIKSAFRRLAKMYHPDKNPAGKEQFTQILKAYETLSDPNLKSAYDYRLNYNISITQTSASRNTNSSANTKNWSFDEKELKRRKYYDEYIKKHEKVKETYKQTSEGKKNYNEFKYILFATPIAAALFLLILNLASPTNSKIAPTKPEKQIPEPKTSALKMGDAPYSDYFGKNKYDTTSKLSLTIVNNTEQELITCLFNNKKFIRSCYIAKGYYAEILQLPKDSLTIKYCTGLYFDYVHELKKANVIGAFKENLEFFESNFPTALNSINELTLQSGINEGFKKVDELKFFAKE